MLFHMFHFNFLFDDFSTKPIGCQFALGFCEIMNEMVLKDKSIVLYNELFWFEILCMLQCVPCVFGLCPIRSNTYDYALLTIFALADFPIKSLLCYHGLVFVLFYTNSASGA